MRELDFTGALAALCAKEQEAAGQDPERMATMIERLAAVLGFTIALAARGSAAEIDKMMEAAEGYAHAEAVAKAPFARFMAEMSNHKKRSQPGGKS